MHTNSIEVSKGLIKAERIEAKNVIKMFEQEKCLFLDLLFQRSYTCRYKRRRRTETGETCNVNGYRNIRNKRNIKVDNNMVPQL